MLTIIRNASAKNHPTCMVPFSTMKEKIAAILKAEGYISDAAIVEKTGKKAIKVQLAYANNQSKIRTISRVSTPGRRIYVPVDGIPYILNGLGMAIISTSRGLMTDRAARADKIGGEVICKVW